MKGREIKRKKDLLEKAQQLQKARRLEESERAYNTLLDALKEEASDKIPGNIRPIEVQYHLAQLYYKMKR
jgi:hypothetical protein